MPNHNDFECSQIQNHNDFGVFDFESSRDFVKNRKIRTTHSVVFYWGVFKKVVNSPIKKIWLNGEWIPAVDKYILEYRLCTLKGNYAHCIRTNETTPLFYPAAFKNDKSFLKK